MPTGLAFLRICKAASKGKDSDMILDGEEGGLAVGRGDAVPQGVERAAQGGVLPAGGLPAGEEEGWLDWKVCRREGIDRR